MTVETGAIGVVGQRRDFTFRSPESLRPRTFLFDLNSEESRQRMVSVGTDMICCTFVGKRLNTNVKFSAPVYHSKQVLSGTGLVG